MSLFIISWFDTTISGLAVIIASPDFTISCLASSLYVASINIDSPAAPVVITPAVVERYIGGS